MPMSSAHKHTQDKHREAACSSLSAHLLPEALIQAQPQRLSGCLLRLCITLLHHWLHQLNEHITQLVQPELIHCLRDTHNMMLITCWVISTSCSIVTWPPAAACLLCHQCGSRVVSGTVIHLCLCAMSPMHSIGPTTCTSSPVHNQALSKHGCFTLAHITMM